MTDHGRPPISPEPSEPTPAPALAELGSAEPDWAPALAGLAGRVLGPVATGVTFAALLGAGRRYVYRATGGRLLIEATDATSAAVGLHHYLREQCRIAVSWDDLRPVPPDHLPDAARSEGAARVSETYYLNFCTFGYTTAWWDWEQWEAEIDWMALRGITAPLMMVGHEAVIEQVLLGEGLEPDRVREFLAGPAYLPWLAMGNLEGFGGPPPQGWIEAHRELAGRILTRQRELGMRPVLPAFTGHVPAELAGPAGARDWQGHRTHVVGPQDPAFRRLTAATVRVQQEFWGTDHRYAADPFIEMVPVESDPGYPGRVAAALLAGLTDADPQATWYLQTWPFSYMADFWTGGRVRTFLGDIDPERLVLLDLWAEAEPQWRRFNGFGGREWIWCALLNFGGRNEPLADLPGATKELDGALDSAHPPIGAGLSMEATRSVPVYFERLLDATWRAPEPLDRWLTDWAGQRYRLPEGPLTARAGAAWQALARTVLDSGSYRIFPEAFTGLLTQRPPADPFRSGQLQRDVADLLWYEPADLIEAWDGLVTLAEDQPQLASGPLGRDLIEVALGVLPRCAELAFLAAYDAEGVRNHGAARRFLTVFEDLEELLATRSEFRYDHWEAEALRWAESPEDARLLADNARRLVTVWGHSGDGYLDDYSARYWAGLVGYYRQRWQQWAKAHPIATSAADQWERRLQDLEHDFLRDGPTTPPASGSVTAISRHLLDTYGPLFIRTARHLRSTMPARRSLPGSVQARTDMHDDDGARP
ncbi:MAG TPA: alpha-N-acetylglucosaminidase TIM-barrel domain-containing protein [Beutenbergiaceae bacterium]|nr:alpha-N-acetylglucosaminidase TIM-barrel domain-containing protein [Beutenbergiaceae bacterium]